MKSQKNQVLHNEKLEVLKDISSTGKERPWSEKKLKNGYLALAYDEIDQKKAERLRECATWLEYEKQSDGLKRLVNANFCRVRLCPMCTWRRGLKIYAQTKAIMDAMEQKKQYGYIFLTLTVKNVIGEELENILDKMLQGWKRFIKRKQIDEIVKGWYRGLEITHNLDVTSENYDTFHPHFHCVFAVNKSYFTDKSYIRQEEWQELWKQSMKLDYSPQVDIRKVKGNTAKAVSEIAKYAVKDSDYLIPEDWDLTMDTVCLLDKVLHKRRLVAYGKKFKELHQKLNLDDVENGDLVHLNDFKDEESKGEKIFYSWNVGYQKYIKNKCF